MFVCFRCTIPNIDNNVNKCNLTEEEIKNLTIPAGEKQVKSQIYAKVGLLLGKIHILSVGGV